MHIILFAVLTQSYLRAASSQPQLQELKWGLWNFFATLSKFVLCPNTAVWTVCGKTCRFSSSFINTVSQEKPRPTWNRQSDSPDDVQSRLFPSVQKVFVLFVADLGKTCIFWGSSLKHVTTVQNDKLNSRRYKTFFSILLLILGYAMSNFFTWEAFLGYSVKI